MTTLTLTTAIAKATRMAILLKKNHHVWIEADEYVIGDDRDARGHFAGYTPLATVDTDGKPTIHHARSI